MTPTDDEELFNRLLWFARNAALVEHREVQLRIGRPERGRCHAVWRRQSRWVPPQRVAETYWPSPHPIGTQSPEARTYGKDPESTSG
jgi:hypothetical protein